jgi:hypothetical protein
MPHSNPYLKLNQHLKTHPKTPRTYLHSILNLLFFSLHFVASSISVAILWKRIIIKVGGKEDVQKGNFPKYFGLEPVVGNSTDGYSRGYKRRV